MQAYRKGRPVMAAAPSAKRKRRLSDTFGVWSSEFYVVKDADAAKGVSPHLGKGRSSRVVCADNAKTSARVAIKVFKADPGEKQSAYEQHAALEIATLLKLQPHPHILALVEPKLLADANGTLHMVTQLAEWDWRAFIRSRYARFAPFRQLKGYIKQALQALEYCHAQRIVHRDIKPENLLITADNVVKLADFGLASQEMWNYPAHTEVVTTLWQRAPEVLICKGRYDYKIDVWSMAMTIIELLVLHPLLAGRTDEHQLALIYETCGTPQIHEWDSEVQLDICRSFKMVRRWDLSNQLIRHAQTHNRTRFMNPDARTMLESMLVLLPSKRCSATDALRSEYLTTKVEELMPYKSEQMIHYRKTQLK